MAVFLHNRFSGSPVAPLPPPPQPTPPTPSTFLVLSCFFLILTFAYLFFSSRVHLLSRRIFAKKDFSPGSSSSSGISWKIRLRLRPCIRCIYISRRFPFAVPRVVCYTGGLYLGLRGLYTLEDLLHPPERRVRVGASDRRGVVS